MNKFKNPIKLKTEIGEGIAKNVYCEMTNVSNTGVFEPSFGGLLPKASNYDVEINANNMMFESKYTIETLNKLIIYGWDITITPSEPEKPAYEAAKRDFSYKWILENNENLNILSTTKLVKMITKHEYDLLSEEQKTSNNIIYIYYEDNKIFLNQLKKIIVANIIFLKRTEYVDGTGEYDIDRINYRGAIINWGYMDDATSHLKLNNSLFQIEYSYESNELSFPILISNESNYDDTVYFNQTSQRIDPNRTARILQTYIDNMSGGSLMVSGNFESWNDIPEEGSVIIDRNNNKKYIVNSITVSEYHHYLDATAQLVEFHAKRRTNMGADTNLQINYIPNNNLVYRKSFKCIQFEFDLSTDKVEKENIYKNDKLEFLLKDNLKSLVFGNLFKTGSYIYDLIGYPTIFKASNNILFNERAYNNFIWDFSFYKTNPIPSNYTNDLGFVDTSTVYLYKGITEEQLNSYPLFNNIVPKKQLMLENDIDKDAYEIFDYTLQASYKGINKTIVREEYVEELLNDSGFPKATMCFYDKHFSKYDVISSKEEDTVGKWSITLGSPIYSSDGVYTINITLNNGSNVMPYKSLVIFNDDKPLFIKNFVEEQGMIDSFSIYIYPKIMTPMRDGVYGKNIK